MILSLISAISENGVIGRDGDLPWRLRDDMKWFKETTMGHPVIMGRRTHESNNGVLEGRANIVVSRTMDAHAPGVEVARSLENAIELAKRHLGNPAGEVFVIGGARVYEDALARADRMYLTRVHETVEGDTRFPRVDWGHWRLVREDRHEADERNEFAYTICVYERLQRNP